MKINLYKNSVHFNSEIPIRAMEIFHYGQFSMDVNYNSIVRYNSEKIIIVFMDQTPLNEISIDYRGNLNIEQVIFYSDDSQVINYGRVVEEPQDIIEEMDIIKYENINDKWEDLSKKNNYPSENVKNEINYLFNGKMNATRLIQRSAPRNKPMPYKRPRRKILK